MNLYDKRRVSLNVLTTVIQVFVTGVVFIVYICPNVVDILF